MQYTCGNKSRFAVTTAAFIKKKTLLTNIEDLNLSKKLEKRCIWRLEVYGAETWTPESR
jgi:hypothetical protein